MDTKYKKLTEEILELAGIRINGSNTWDIRIVNDEFYKRAITEGELGIGESYMEGWWDAEKIDEFIFRVLTAQLDKKILRKISILAKLFVARLINQQTKQRAFIVGEKHYDLGNDLFRDMLDSRMNYSCAYWKDADTLDKAQENKLDLICRKVGIKPGMRILDIGCGWSAFGKYAAAMYHAEVVGITVSKEQLELGKKLCQDLPVEIRLMDYRDLNEKFDRIISVGMLEHVGYKNYYTYFNIVHNCLKEDGLALIQTIGNLKSEQANDLWTDKYIFPNGMIPSIAQIGKATEKLFVMEDWHNFGADYDKTLMAWYSNFVSNCDKIKGTYSERFFRMWKYFLLSSAGSFRSRKRNQLWQIVLSKNGVSGGYQSVR